jgi:hypothetical protein
MFDTGQCRRLINVITFSLSHFTIGDIVMSKSRVQELVAQITTEVNNAALNPSTVELTKQLSQDVNEYLASSVTPTMRTPSLLEQAQTLEIEYAQSHPRIEGIVNEIIDILSRMGI